MSDVIDLGDVRREREGAAIRIGVLPQELVDQSIEVSAIGGEVEMLFGCHLGTLTPTQARVLGEWLLEVAEEAAFPQYLDESSTSS